MGYQLGRFQLPAKDYVAPGGTPQALHRSANVVDECCPVCSQELVHEKSRAICRSATCRYRLVFHHAEP